MGSDPLKDPLKMLLLARVTFRYETPSIEMECQPIVR